MSAPQQGLAKQKTKTEKLSFDREPPSSQGAEQGIISCCLIDPEKSIPVCIEKFQGHEAFFDNRYQDLFMVLTDMYDGRESIDEITLRQKLTDNHLLEAVGGAEHLQQLRDFTPSIANLPYYLDIVYEKRDDFEVETIIDEAEKVIFAVGQMRFARKLTNTKEIVKGAINILEDMFTNRGKMRGLSTGLVDLDLYYRGLKAGEMHVVAGRPSMGKTSLAMQIAEVVALDQRVPVGVFSLEMTAESLVLRMIAARAGIDLRQVERGFFTEKDQFNLAESAKKIAGAPIYFEDESGISILNLRSKARRMVQLYGIKLIVIDYLQLLHSDNRKCESRQQEVADISNGIKNMAKELGIPVIVICQLNRDIEKRAGPPKMSDLRESGAIEQDADSISILWKDKDDDAPSTEAEARLPVKVTLSILKQRNGPTGDIELMFKKQITRFFNIEKKPETPNE